MAQSSTLSTTSMPDRPLAGKSAIVITDEKIGMQVQVKGVADALGLDWKAVEVAPRGIWKVLAPWGPPDPRDGVGRAGGPLGPPWPDVVLATGRLSIPALRRLHRLAGVKTYTIVLQDPRTSADTADLIWVPEHDRRRGDNVITTLTAAHGFSPERLARLRSDRPHWLEPLKSPRIAVVLGGPNAVYPFGDTDIARLVASITALAKLGPSFMVTASRRTPPALLTAVQNAIAHCPSFIWDGQGANPYPHFLAHADRFIVTGDSVNMTGEPLVTGKPVWVFEPSGGSAKFARFHESLRRYGATRTLPDAAKSLDDWSYAPLDAAAEIAREVERRWWLRRTLRNEV